MKKIVSILLICILTLSLAGCNKEKEKKSIEKPLNVLTKTWESYGKNDKFHVMGGDFNHQVEDEPGILDVKDKESLRSMLIVPESAVEKISGAASMIHAMNANIFTSGAFRLKNKDDVTPFINTMKDAILSNQWMCGFPEFLAIAKIDERNIVVTFGNEEMVKNFEKKLEKRYKEAELVVGISLVE